MSRPMSKDELAMLIAYAPDDALTLGRELRTYTDHMIAAGIIVCTGTTVDDERLVNLYWLIGPGETGVRVLVRDLNGPYVMDRPGFCVKCRRKWKAAVEVVKSMKMKGGTRDEATAEGGEGGEAESERRCY